MILLWYNYRKNAKNESWTWNMGSVGKNLTFTMPRIIIRLSSKHVPLGYTHHSDFHRFLMFSLSSWGHDKFPAPCALKFLHHLSPFLSILQAQLYCHIGISGPVWNIRNKFMVVGWKDQTIFLQAFLKRDRVFLWPYFREIGLYDNIQQKTIKEKQFSQKLFNFLLLQFCNYIL